jgi:pimeloyl-ACP methyl ester carboxylesterase
MRMLQMRWLHSATTALAAGALAAAPPAGASASAHRANGNVAVVECRGDGDSCRARVGLAGGVSTKKVVIRLSDTYLRLASVRPNRRSLSGAYSLGRHRLRRGGSEYVVMLNAARSIRRGSYLVFSFRAAAGRGDFARRVEIGGGRRLYLECRGRGGPTVVLESGYRGAANGWSVSERGSERTAVLPAIARFTRVCAYDRPGTIRDVDRFSRSDPVPMPRTAEDAVADLHALLRAAHVPGPYVLVGHSLGGLFVRRYASTYPRQVAGLVLVDALYERLEALLGPDRWGAYVRFQLLPVPGLDYPELETVDFAASAAQMRRAAAARPPRLTLPLVVLSKGRPFDLPPGAQLGFPIAELDRAWASAQDELATLLPYARHVVATESGHNIHVEQPELVIRAVRRVVRALRPTVVRCRGGGGLCRARVGLAGGASDKQVLIRLSDTDLRLASVRPNRRSLRGAYGLAGHRLRAGGSEYVVTLNALQSIPRSSYLIFTFRAAAPRHGGQGVGRASGDSRGTQPRGSFSPP